MTPRRRTRAAGPVSRLVLRGAALAAGGIAAGELLARVAGAGLVRATGETVRWLLAGAGVPAVLDAGVLAAPGRFGYEITPACLGLGPAAVVAAVAAWRAGSPARRLGLALAGGAAILAANLLRLAGLFCLGRAAPEHFELFHHGLGQAWMLAAMAAFLLLTPPEAPDRAVPEAPR